MPVSQLRFSSSRPSTRPRVSRHARRLLSLLLVAVLALPAMLAADRVAIEVDGQTQHVRAYGGTVDQVLASAGIEVGPHDEVAPAPNAEVADGLEVEVVRAVPVTLQFRDHTRELPVAGETVRDVLVAAGIGPIRGLSVEPDLDTPLDQVDHVEVHQPVTVTVRADGEVSRVHLTTGGTVGDALELAGVEVDGQDQLSIPASRDISHRGADPVTVTVTRVDSEQVVEEVALPFQEQVVETADMYEDESAVTQDGVEGLRRDTYRVTRENGEVVDRELVDQEVVREPQPRMVQVGTAERPPPPPPEPEPEPGDGDAVWYRLAQCESGQRWHLDGKYDGGLQFHPDTWNAWKPSGYPAYAYQATAAQQIHVGKRLQAAQGWSPWPECSRKLGLR